MEMNTGPYLDLYITIRQSAQYETGTEL